MLVLAGVEIGDRASILRVGRGEPRGAGWV